jgi:23S rRNA pseudouridine2605 synthase
MRRPLDSARGMTSRVRIQKALAARGIGSRRQVEDWIAAGRISVNGIAATLGQAIGPRDEVRLDGRKLRLQWADESGPAAVVYHRPAREGIRDPVEGAGRASLERLPPARGGRWIPVNPMGLGEGGLELFVSDGRVAEALMRASGNLRCEYSLRVRGDFDESRVDDLLDAAHRDICAEDGLLELEYAGGEGANRWARAVVSGLRPRDLRRLFESVGLEVNRVLRTRFGPVTLDRGLARGQSRRLTQGEFGALLDAAGVARDVLDRAVPAGRSGKKTRRPRSPGQPRAGAKRSRR